MHTCLIRLPPHSLAHKVSIHAPVQLKPVATCKPWRGCDQQDGCDQRLQQGRLQQWDKTCKGLQTERRRGGNDDGAAASRRSSNKEAWRRLSSVIAACSSPASPGEDFPSTELGSKIDLKLPRRRLQLSFTCDACGARSQRLINPDAYARGTVFVQCAGCEVYHKLVDNLGLIEEYDFREEANNKADGMDLNEVE